MLNSFSGCLHTKGNPYMLGILSPVSNLMLLLQYECFCPVVNDSMQNTTHDDSVEFSSAKP